MRILFRENRIKVWLLITLMATVAILVAGTTLIVLYKAAIKQQSQRLVEIAQSQARVLEVLIQYEYKSNNQTTLPKRQHLDAVINQFRSAYRRFQGIGATGEFTIAQRNGDLIDFLLISGQYQEHANITLPLDSPLAKPMQLALTGQSGILVAVDYLGNRVIAAHESINELNLGVVIKINVAEIDAPFIRAGIIAGCVGFVFIIIGTFLIFRISAPLLRSIEENKSQLRTILDRVVDGILTINESGKIKTINPSAAKMFGYEQQELIDQQIDILVPQKLRTKHQYLLNKFTGSGKEKILGVSREIEGQKKNGILFPVEIAISKAAIDNRTTFISIIRDITARKRNEHELNRHREILEEQVAKRTEELANANKKLEVLARSDGLTGIANRRVFDEELSREIRRSARTDSIFSLLICDIDFFKNYNDTYGHPQGDICLQQVAAIINKTFQRAGELVARYGGEEFAVILAGVNRTEVAELAEQLRTKIWDLNIPHPSSAIADRITISIGVATFQAAKSRSNKQVIKTADDALYEAKKNGRNQVTVAEMSSGMDSPHDQYDINVN